METEIFENGNLYGLTTGQTKPERKWNPHPAFAGVSLKHLITGAQTGNLFSSHIVRIEPGCILDVHIHEGKAELHEVMEGNGQCFIGGREFIYSPGDCAIIPAGTVHKVVASEEGLILFAKFIPALL